MEKKVIVLEEGQELQHEDVYCKHCGACGEEGCCSGEMCTNEKDGLYCEYYKWLKENG